MLQRNTALLSTLCIVLGAVVGMLVGGAIAPPVADEPWIKTYQGLVGAFLGIASGGIGLGVATFNVLRQMRINLISREEDRIERTLPGLRDARAYLYDLMIRLRPIEPSMFDDAIVYIGINEIAAIDGVVERSLPRADDRVRQVVVNALYGIAAAAFAIRAARRHVIDVSRLRTEGDDLGTAQYKNAVGNFEAQIERAKHYISELRSDADALHAQVIMLERRLPRFREELERYFA